MTTDFERGDLNFEGKQQTTSVIHNLKNYSPYFILINKQAAISEDATISVRQMSKKVEIFSTKNNIVVEHQKIDLCFQKRFERKYVQDFKEK